MARVDVRSARRAARAGHSGVSCRRRNGCPGGVLAHGGSDDGRRFFLSEAASLAGRGAAVVLPAIRLRQDGGVDDFATDVRDAVLTERAALDVLTDWVGAPPGELSFLGHSAGGALGAFLCAVEPRLSRIGIFAYGAGTLPRAARARAVQSGLPFTRERAAAADWFDTTRFVSTDRSARLLVQHGRVDRTVPIEEGRALFDAAAASKAWAEYDWDHGLDADRQARKDRPISCRREPVARGSEYTQSLILGVLLMPVPSC